MPVFFFALFWCQIKAERNLKTQGGDAIANVADLSQMRVAGHLQTETCIRAGVVMKTILIKKHKKKIWFCVVREFFFIRLFQVFASESGLTQAGDSDFLNLCGGTADYASVCQAGEKFQEAAAFAAPLPPGSGCGRICCKN